jgi:hypothetical protein
MEGKVNASFLRCRSAGGAAARAGKEGSLIVGYVGRVDEPATGSRVSSSLTLFTAARLRFAGGSCTLAKGDDARAGLEPAADELFGTHATNSPPVFRLLKTIGGKREEASLRQQFGWPILNSNSETQLQAQTAYHHCIKMSRIPIRVLL